MRFADDFDASTRATLCDALAAELGIIDHWEESDAHWATAVKLWHSLGEPHREGDALRAGSKARWRLSMGDDSTALLTAALEVLEPLGPSVELAGAVKEHAGSQMINGGQPRRDRDRRAGHRARREIRPARCPQRCPRHPGVLVERSRAAVDPHDAARARGGSRPRLRHPGRPRLHQLLRQPRGRRTHRRG
ncbi:hypothetical protein [Nocardioides sp. B-3]|uniref:hypothetical protein n=1 Tax=Nocardioides sp. B-3 TaxID=2895565 RepID=UPI002152C742|nr:hypothetical protein [Nocardioides sp. B-3]UUZ58894.1 hypothetical protein LP418_22985 [Nocardioides sp. B-3]